MLISVLNCTVATVFPSFTEILSNGIPGILMQNKVGGASWANQTQLLSTSKSESGMIVGWRAGLPPHDSLHLSALALRKRGYSLLFFLANCETKREYDSWGISIVPSTLEERRSSHAPRITVL